MILKKNLKIKNKKREKKKRKKRERNDDDCIFGNSLTCKHFQNSLTM